MRRIFAAIGAALRAAFSAFRFAISIPGRAIAWLLGGTAAPAPVGDSPLVEELKDELENSRAAALAASSEAASKLAAAIRMWCCAALEADGPVPVPAYPQVSRQVAAWLPGLTRNECQTLALAKENEISDHVDGRRTIAGVRPVQRLQPLPAWGPASVMLRTPTPDDATDDAPAPLGMRP